MIMISARCVCVAPRRGSTAAYLQGCTQVLLNLLPNADRLSKHLRVGRVDLADSRRTGRVTFSLSPRVRVCVIEIVRWVYEYFFCERDRRSDPYYVGLWWTFY